MALNSGTLADRTIRDVEQYVAEWMSKNGVPGASVAIVTCSPATGAGEDEGSSATGAGEDDGSSAIGAGEDEGSSAIGAEEDDGSSATGADEDGQELAYAEGFGARDLDDDLPATPDTLYGIGSCTKSVVATAVLQCVERTDLDLSDPIADYLPHLADVPGEPITVESLLNHTSGMPSDGNLSALVTRLTDIDDANTPLTSDDDFRRHVEGSVDERYTEGEQFFYYNTGFSLLGDLVAEVTGVEFERYVQREIFGPLGMSRSCFTQSRFEAEEDRMSAYYEEVAEDGDSTWQEGELGFSETMYAPGGLASSVVETSQFLRALMNDGVFEGERVLEAESVGAMTTPSATRYETVDGVKREYGYGLSSQGYLGDRLVGHGGMMGTTTAYIGYLEDAGVGVVVACNTAPAQHPTVAGHALLAILQGEAPERTVPQLALEDKADRLVGEYESYRGIQTATVEKDGTTLFVEVDGRLGDRSFTLFPENADPDDLTYYTVSGDGRIPVEFFETADGTDMLLQRWRLHRQHE